MTIEKLLEGIELPKWARWAAQDDRGRVCVFADKPRIYDGTYGYWRLAKGSSHVLAILNAKVAGDWRDTLTRLEARE